MKNDLFATKPPMVGPMIQARLPATLRMPNPSGALVFRQDIRHHCLAGRPANIRERADDRCQWEKHRQVIHQPQG